MSTPPVVFDPDLTVVSDLPWVDVLLDFRARRDRPLSRKKPAARHIRVSGTSVWVVTEGTETYLYWADKTGFRGAVVARYPRLWENESEQEAVNIRKLLPSLAHLTDSTKNVNIRSKDTERVFADNLDYLRETLLDPARLAVPVRGVPESCNHAAYRFAWAAMGATVEELPGMLRDTSVAEDIEWGQRPLPMHPYGTAYQFPARFDWEGLKVAQNWLAGGFTIAEIPYWHQTVATYGAFFTANNPSALLGVGQIQGMRGFRDAGMSPAEAALWVRASNGGRGFDFERVTTKALLRHHRNGVAPETVAWAASDYEGTNGRFAANRIDEHVRLWLRDVPVERLGWYVAAGMNRREAVAMERHDPPDIETFQMMASLRGREFPDPKTFPLPSEPG